MVRHISRTERIWIIDENIYPGLEWGLKIMKVKFRIQPTDERDFINVFQRLSIITFC